MATSQVQHLEIETYFAIEHLWPPQQQPHVTAPLPGHYTLWVIDRGEVHVQIENSCWTLGSGDVFFAPRREARHILVPKGAHWWSIDFLPRWFNGIDPLQALNEPVVWQASEEGDELRRLMEMLVKRWMAPWQKGPLQSSVVNQYLQQLPEQYAAFSAEARFMCHGLAQAIFGWCLERLAQNPQQVPIGEPLPAWLQQVLCLIEENPTLSIEELSRQAAFSPVQMRRLFHRWLGVSPRQYLLQRRMDKARILLMETTWTVSAVAQSVGFASLSSFARAFKSVYGIAPAQLRQASREATARNPFVL